MLLLLGGMVVLITAQVAFRYVLNQPLAWTEEVARHLMIWAALLGAAMAYRRKAHLGMDLLVRLATPAWRRRIETLVHLLSLGFFLLLLVTGIPLVEKTMRQFSSAIRIPMGFIYASIPVGAGLVILFAVEKLLLLFAPEPAPDSPEVRGAPAP